MQIDLSASNVLVTGASRGIGRAIARTLAASGASVGVHYGAGREEALALVDEIEDRYGGTAHALQADFREASAPGTLWRKAEARFDRIDGLVNNAGVARPAPLDAEVERWREVWEETLAVNLAAAAELTRRAVTHFRARGGGRIVTMSSRAAFRGDEPEYLAYAASKGGLVALTRSIARGCGEDGVRAFLLAPGFTDTEMAEAFIARFGPEIAERDRALGAMTRPEDVAPTAAFLLSGLADHATGTTIDLNAGSYMH